MARNHAIDTALLVSGDEDILVGVQTAQSFGVRVHLLGIDPAHSQSQRLMNEADLCHEWSAGIVTPWISLKSFASGPLPATAGDFGALQTDDGGAAAPSPTITSEQMAVIAENLSRELGERGDLIIANWDRVKRIPPDINLKLMHAASELIGRSIEPRERITVRRLFVDALRVAANGVRVATDEPADQEAVSHPEDGGSDDGADPALNGASVGD